MVKPNNIGGLGRDKRIWVMYAMINKFIKKRRLKSGTVKYHLTSNVRMSIVRVCVLVFTMVIIFAGVMIHYRKNNHLTDSREKTAMTTTTNDGSSGKPNYFGSGRGRNLIMIQVESLQNFPLYTYMNKQEVSPVINRLAYESLYFPNIFQQMGPGNTSDAEFLVNTSIYPTGTSPMSESYGDRELPSLARLMKKQGYRTATFHVNDVSFWNRDQMYPALGFDRYYDKPYYVEDDFNKFGSSDEELYRVCGLKLKELKTMGRDFYAQMVTVSSHYPFKIPEKSKSLQLPDHMKNTHIGDYLTAVHYADAALGTFIDTLKSKGMWDNSVFVIYGDHFGLKKGMYKPSDVSEALDIPYHENISRLNVPLIIHLPGQTEGQIITQVGGQVDILPTLANIMGVSFRKKEFKGFGHDLMNISRNLIGIRYYMPSGTFINDEILFVPGKGFADGTAVSLTSLKPILDYSQYRNDFYSNLDRMKESDRYVRQLPKRGSAETRKSVSPTLHP